MAALLRVACLRIVGGRAYGRHGEPIGQNTASAASPHDDEIERLEHLHVVSFVPLFIDNYPKLLTA
jgi:hypothetical protein